MALIKQIQLIIKFEICYRSTKIRNWSTELWAHKNNPTAIAHKRGKQLIYLLLNIKLIVKFEICYRWNKIRKWSTEFWAHKNNPTAIAHKRGISQELQVVIWVLTPKEY